MILGWIIVAVGVGVTFAARTQIKKATRRPANGEEKTLARLEMKCRSFSLLVSAVRIYAVMHTPVPAVSK